MLTFIAVFMPTIKTIKS